MKEYIIVGDTSEFKDCLIYTCGKNKEKADDILHRMLAEPNSTDQYFLKKHTNLRVKEIDSEDAWWNQGGLD